MSNEQDIIYSRPVLDFITVSTEYCKILENQDHKQRAMFIDLMRRLLPMIYLKVSLLPDIPEAPGYNESCVTEEDYDNIRIAVAHIMGEFDDYLDVFVEDFKYSEQPVLRTISEDLADLYQVLRELVETYRLGHEEAMQVALHEAKEQFTTAWGQTLLNALRALHDAKYGGRNE